MTISARLLRFQHVFPFGSDELGGLMGLMSDPSRYAAAETLTEAGRHSPHLFFILSGIACRSITLQDGRRQVIAHLVPGDLSDPRGCFTQSSDFSVLTLSEVEAAMVSRHDLADLAQRSPRLMRELWRRVTIEDATARQWLLNVGRRTAMERVAHLLCEHFVRMDAMGMVSGDSCHFPLTQVDMADALALSAVHVNRTLMKLRRGGLVSLTEHRLTIPNMKALQENAGFEPDYLQINRGVAAKALIETAEPARAGRNLSLPRLTTLAHGLNGRRV